MQRINIMAPIRNLDMARYQADAGANEVYLGLDGRNVNEEFVNFTFNGRYNKMDDIQCQVESVKELNDIVAYAHSRGLKVNYAVNIHYLSHDVEDELNEYLDYGIAAGCDSLIVSNLGVIQHIRKRGITLPILAGVFLVIPNVEFTYMLQELGVDRVVLPQGITIDELKEFKARSALGIEIFGHFGGGNNCGRCMMLHSPTVVDIGPGCRSTYEVFDGGDLIDNENYFLDAACDCSLCSLPELMELGIDAIKIVGRESNNAFLNSKVTEMYNLVQGYVLDGMKMSDIKKKLKDEQLVWTSMWLPRFCERKRCRFKPTKITNSYIV